MEERPIAIDVQSVTKRYGSKSNSDALSNISFQVPLGKVCCLLGPNGSGKTTLLKILTGLVSPTSGSVSIMGAYATTYDNFPVGQLFDVALRMK